MIHHLQEKEGVSVHFLEIYRITSALCISQLILLTFICISRSGNIFTTEYNLILFLTVILHLQILKTPLLNFRPQMLRMKFRKQGPILSTWLCPSCLVLQARGGWRRKQPSAGSVASVASIPSLLRIFKPPFLLS